MCTHILIDRGLVDFDAPVARYWPEFAAAGKSGVLVRHVLSHTCGVIYCDRAPPGSWFDWAVHIRAIEQQEPAWTPGTKGAYNSINIGYILGEIVRRVTGKTVGTFLREEVTDKLGADYHIGLRPDEIARVSDMHRNPKNSSSRSRPTRRRRSGRAFRSAPKFGYFQNCREVRELEVPSFGGHGNARAVARIYAMLAGDGSVDGVRVLSPGAVERASQLVWEDDCIMTQRRIRMGYGFMHNEPDTAPMGESMKAFGHTGTGGAFAWCDRSATSRLRTAPTSSAKARASARAARHSASRQAEEGGRRG